MRTLPCAMTVAGSDSGGAAGIQADLKTFASFRVYGTSAVTAVTVQNTTGVYDVHVLPASQVGAQIDAVMEDIPVQAIKTGMLANEDIVEIVAHKMQAYRVENLVVDPVMVSSSGHTLLSPQAVAVYKEKLIPLALLVTPNLPEAGVLTGVKIEDEQSLLQAARDILNLGARWVLLKGGHRCFAGEENVMIDLLIGHEHIYRIENPRWQTSNTHGTGCTLSAAVAAGLARGWDLLRSVQVACQYVNRAIAEAPAIGRGHGPLNHFVCGPWS
ncbi:MAG: bifunctional hydroxymethylpyrimidine kinase/phosphomethylpyrimidine kinase [Desulfurispora sp.]|uniref:bifunctional hydroxymethylpyrimidine kinase/phosphomethylpyrimidine kinase n=1 Tax=Desulfurispora sp. TaxID=3014275 RepID=UPI00404A85DF